MIDKKITFDRFIRWMLTAAVVVGVVYLLSYLSGVLLPFFLAWLIAYLLYPIVCFVQYRMHVPTRALSIIVTLVAVIAVISLVVWLIVPPMVEQFGRLSELIAQYVRTKTNTDSVSEAVRGWLSANSTQIETFVKNYDVMSVLKALAPRLFNVIGYTATIAVGIAAALMCLMYLFFILLDYEWLTDNWIRLFPKSNRAFWQSLQQNAEREMNNYMRGQCLVAMCMGILFCIGFTIIDFPMAIALGILIGIMDLVPYLHTFALIPTAFLALLKAADTGQNFWVILLSAVAVFIIVQIIIDMVITPKIMGKAMRLNPAILLLSLSIWGTLLGFVGLIIALPLTTLLMAYYRRYVTSDDDDTPATATPPATTESAATPAAAATPTTDASAASETGQ